MGAEILPLALESRAMTLLLATSSIMRVASEPPSATYNFLAMGDWGDDSTGQHAAAAGSAFTFCFLLHSLQGYTYANNFTTFS